MTPVEYVMMFVWFPFCVAAFILWILIEHDSAQKGYYDLCYKHAIERQQAAFKLTNYGIILEKDQQH